MSGWCLWAIRILPLAAGLGLWLSPESIANEIAKKYEDRAIAAMRLWEYDREEYLKLTRLTPGERRELEGYLRRADRKDERLYHGVALLIALNCGRIPEGRSIYLAVQRYRCAGEPLSYLAFHAIEFGNFYLFAFVKAEDRQRTIDFLRRYLEFWRQERARGDKGMPPGATDFLAIEEVRSFLEEGGYPPAAE